MLYGRTIQPLWQGERQSVDWAGAALLTAALAAATLALTDDGADPRPAIVSIAIGLSALLLLLVFIRTEWLAERPMIRLQSFSEPHFAAAMAMYFLLGGALIVALVDVPLMANLLFQASAVQGGLALMRLLLLLPLGGVVGGWACSHIGRRATAAAGVTLAIIGFLLMRSWPPIPSSRDLWLSLGAIGFGLGLCDAPIVTTVVDTVRRTERATASALLLVLWTSGMIVGLGLLGTRGLSSFSTRAAALFREQGANLDLVAIQRIERQTFNGTLVGAIVALALALALTLLLETGRSHSLRWNPLTATEE
jgi:MFS family permease